MTISSIRIEGGLLGPDILEQLLTGELPGQKPGDFGLPGKRNLTDEIAAVFADARALWGVFQNRLQRLSETDMATSVTRDAWVIPFLGLLGYELRFNQKAYEVDGLTFAISHRAYYPASSGKGARDERTPPSPSGRGAGGEGEGDDNAPPVHIVGARQELGRLPPSGRPRLAPHSLVQEYLNRTEHLWGIVTNGLVLRLLRDSTYVRRQAYIEFDLRQIFEGQLFNDFVVLYRLLHRTRLPRGMADAKDCLLEKYYQHGLEQGGRVREGLRDGVEECLKRLAEGFLSHPANEDLRRRASPDYTGNDRITPEEFYRQLLVLVYRFLFLLVSEDRGLLSSDPLYREHYSVGRLRRLLDRQSASTEHDDLWCSLRVLWLVLVKDQPHQALGNKPLAAALGLPILNGQLFDRLDLDACWITNRDLLEAFWYLAYYRPEPNAPPRRVNYAALDVEELGSVYESLLDYHPVITSDGRGRLRFDLHPGLERKSTGSYYTPAELVAELIRSALDPVIAERLKAAKTPEEKDRALLSIRVCDPACGSGHFLLAAARRLGKELARIRTGEEEPAPERVREAIRDVVSHCIYGVDKNPLAVDLCRVALWLESHTGDKPLTFLDHRIRCGDSLVGVFDLSVLRRGIPDEAFAPVTGDDKGFARTVAKRNREECRGYRDLIHWNAETAVKEFAQHSQDIDAIADDSPEAIRRKKQLYDAMRHSPAALRQRQACDLWTAAFFQWLRRDSNVVITTAALSDHLAGRPVDPRVLAQAEALAARHRFFHWPLEFPEVFAAGGFDVVLGNPPW
ncbi:MAG TPA: N-6 DNA methylase, partial [Thermogutta sp.]|nr:N-6 DNA methylase [Thermogutta sp.]